jgi:2-keto-4-pentenoate hydratase
MFFSSASRIGIDRFIQPRIEPEIAFLLGAPLKGPGVEFDDAEDAIDAVMPALEIIDSRIQNWRITLVDTVADNASSAAVVLGDPVPLDAASLPNVRGVLLCDDIEIVSGFGRDVMESPINALAWLANRLGELGQSLGANEIIMPGSLCASAPIRSGMKVEARFEGLGSVSAHFEQELQEER